MIMDAHQSIATREYAEDQLPIGYLPDAAKALPDISSPSYMYPGSLMHFHQKRSVSNRPVKNIWE